MRQDISLMFTNFEILEEKFKFVLTTPTTTNCNWFQWLPNDCNNNQTGFRSDLG